MSDHETKDIASTPSPAAQRMHARIKLVRDVYGGTRIMRDAAQTYLPKHPAEESDTYTVRLGSAVLYNAFRRTVEGLLGMIFRKDIVLSQDMPDSIKEHMEDIDRRGRSLNQFARAAGDAAMIDGISFLFVDFTNPAEGVATLADEREQGLRPAWVLYTAHDFISAQFVETRGEPILSQIVFREMIAQSVGAFITSEVEQFRVLRLVNGDGGLTGEWFLLREDEKGNLAVVEGGTFEMPDETSIPVFPVYGRRIGSFEGEPPLEDLAEENVAHWRLRADHLNALHIANVPIAVFIGAESDEVDKPDLKIGPGFGIDLPKGADAKYMEFSGKSLEHSREELRDIEQRMASLGLSMLQRQTRSAETAQAKQLDKAAEDSALATFASSLEETVNAALQMHGRWIREPNPGTITINRDYGVERLTAQEIQQWTLMVGSGVVSIETMWDAMVRGEVLPDTFDPELEVDRLLTGPGMAVPQPEPEPEPKVDDEAA